MTTPTAQLQLQPQPQTEHSGDGRTLMAAVLFADLVGYSRKAVTDQMAAKEELREFLQAALDPVGVGRRVVVDTGDGAAMAFLADPEHALYVALRLRHDLEAAEGRGLLRPADLRLGINLGPVRRIVDVNGRPNLVGEGMNSAERVMSFSAPGEITASRSYGDAISCLHSSYQSLFEPMGERADKHGRRHEIFRIVPSERALEAAAASLAQVEERATPDDPASVSPVAPARRGRRPRADQIAIAAAVIGLLGAGIVAWPLRGGGDRPSAEPRSPAETAAPASAPVSASESAGPTSTVDARPSAPALPAQPVKADEQAAAPTAASAAPPADESAREDPVPTVPAPAARETVKAPRSQRRAADTGISPRCTSLLQRAALGERLPPLEQQELRTSCR